MRNNIELDFQIEARNMKRVESNLRPMLPAQCHDEGLRFDVSLPQVIDELVTEKVLVMTYVDGFKINDLAALNHYGVDRLDLITAVTRAFAHQIFVDGFYSGVCSIKELLISIQMS